MTDPYIFEELKAVASGANTGASGTYTKEVFLTEYPEFTDGHGASILPDSYITKVVDTANDTVRPEIWGSEYPLAVGLFVAHYCAMRLQTYATSGTASTTAGRAQATGVVKSATMGDTSVSYDNSAVTAGIEKSGTWSETKYGSQYITMAQKYGLAGGFYVGR